MLITDYSEQNLRSENYKLSSVIPELLTAGMIFILPIVFLLVISAQ